MPDPAIPRAISVAAPNSTHADSNFDPQARHQSSSPNGLERLSEHLATLEQAWAVALAANDQLRAHSEEVAAAYEDLLGAKADRGLGVNLQGGYQLFDDERSIHTATLLNRLPFRQRESAFFGALSELPLYTAGRIKHSVKAAELSWISHSQDLETLKLDVMLAVARAYLDVLRSAQSVDVARSAVNSLNVHTRDVQLAAKQGRAAKNDVLTVRVKLSNAEQDMRHAENLLRASRYQFNRLMNRPLDHPVNLAAVSSEFGKKAARLSVDEWTARALSLRTEISSLAARAESLDNRSSARISTKRPHVHLEGRVEYEENRFQDPELVTGAAVTARWKLWDAGRAQRQANSLALKAASLRTLIRHQESIIEQEVRHAWDALGVALSSIEAARVDINRSQENLRVSRKRFAMGSALSTDVLDAETLRRESNQRFTDAVHDAALAALTLRRAAGDL